MTRFANPKAMQNFTNQFGAAAAMGGNPRAGGVSNTGNMGPRPMLPAAPIRPGVKPTVTGAPDKNLPFIIDNKPIPGMRPGVTTGGPKPGVAIGPQNINPARPPTPAPATAPATAPASINGLGSRFARAAKPMKKGGKVSSASKRADGCCIKGKTKGKMV